MDTMKLQITLPSNIFGFLDESSRNIGKSKSKIIEEALREYSEKIQDIEDIIMVNKKTEWITNEQLTKELGFDILDRGKKIFEKNKK